MGNKGAQLLQNLEMSGSEEEVRDCLNDLETGNEVSEQFSKVVLLITRGI